MFIALLVAWRCGTFSPPDKPGYDEAIYAAYAQLIGEHGLAGFRHLIQIWPTNDTLSKGPSPLRILWEIVTALPCKLLGDYSVRNIALISAFFGIVTVMLCTVLALRWTSPAQGFLTGVLLVASPIANALSKRALQDTEFAFVVTLCVFFLDNYWRKERTLDLVGLSLSLYAGFLSKESFPALYPGFGLACILYAKHYGAIHRRWWRIALPFVGAPIAAFLTLAFCCGGFTELHDAYLAYIQAQKAIPYAIEYQDGPWFRYLVDLLLLSPWLFVFALLGAFTCYMSSAASFGSRLAGVYLLATLAVFGSLSLMNIRFILFGDLYVCLLAVVGISAFVAAIIRDPRTQRVVILAVVGLVVATGFLQFRRLFVEGNAYDPVTFELVVGNRMAPRQ